MLQSHKQSIVKNQHQRFVISRIRSRCQRRHEPTLAAPEQCHALRVYKIPPFHRCSDVFHILFFCEYGNLSSDSIALAVVAASAKIKDIACNPSSTCATPQLWPPNATYSRPMHCHFRILHAVFRLFIGCTKSYRLSLGQQLLKHSSR